MVGKTRSAPTLASSPDPAEQAVGCRGQAYRLLGREQEALEDFARATEFDPGYKPAGD